MTVSFFASADERSGGSKSHGPVQPALQKIIDRRNAAGGIANRAVKPIWALDALGGDEQRADDQLKEVCAVGVREHSSFAIQPTDRGGAFGRLERAGCVSSVRGINFIPDRLVNTTNLADTRDVVAPYAMGDVTAGRVLVQRLSAQGFFDGARQVAVSIQVGNSTPRCEPF
ncbi:hypothetical protein [Actinopolymorpha alba]|uniref:hypothetical protein n=1 Tax=Actinopolymorpha alba TaxID=533267 RepID=UPI0012F65901|nr:hypothetical protein [Actinopolymorpha alba]